MFGILSALPVGGPDRCREGISFVIPNLLLFQGSAVASTSKARISN